MKGPREPTRRRFRKKGNERENGSVFCAKEEKGSYIHSTTFENIISGGKEGTRKQMFAQKGEGKGDEISTTRRERKSPFFSEISQEKETGDVLIP